MVTSQFNIRITRELGIELDRLSKILKISKSEYVKVRLAEAVLKDVEEFRKNNKPITTKEIKKGLK